MPITWDRYDENGPVHTRRETVYQGAVLCTRERNYPDDSDFYAVVWDEETQSLRYIEYATTRFCSYNNQAEADATDEVKAKARAWLYDYFLKEWGMWNQCQVQRPEKGRRVKVTKGWKIPVGTEGVVFWAGRFRYGRGRFQTTDRVGIELADGRRVFTDASNIQVVQPANYLRPEAEGEAYARQRQEYWHGPFLPPGIPSF